jgi:acyl-CoA dehydrogenase
MRTIGRAERAFEDTVARAKQRVNFGSAIADKGSFREKLAEMRIDIDQSRLLTLHAAAKMDAVGNKAARKEIAMIKVAAPRMAQRVMDFAIQVHGGGGVSQDFNVAEGYAHLRTLRLADGPDEVHLESIAKMELRKQGR